MLVWMRRMPIVSLAQGSRTGLPNRALKQQFNATSPMQGRCKADVYSIAAGRVGTKVPGSNMPGRKIPASGRA
jgi:hypothetical protein